MLLLAVLARTVVPTAQAQSEPEEDEETLEVEQAEEALEPQAEQVLRARLTLPVRNYESTAQVREGSPPPAEAPWEEPVWWQVTVPEAGEAVVEVGEREVARRQENGVYPLVMPVPPSLKLRDRVRVRLQPRRPGAPTWEHTVPLETVVRDAGARPVGHTLVKGVSLVDGHLVVEAEDLYLAGRGEGLRWRRTYTNRGGLEGPLGRGWCTTYLSYVVPNTVEIVPTRYLWVGGGCTGQVFHCQAKTRECQGQKGHQGTLQEVKEGPGRGQHVVYRTKQGTEYHYGLVTTTPWGPRQPLLAIRSTTGQEVTLEYEGGVLKRVYEPGRKRWLELLHTLPDEAHTPLLSQVRLAVEGQGVQACVSHGYSPRGQLTRVQRFEGDCPASGHDKALVREEIYTYADSPQRELQDNLVAHTAPNGDATRYEYYTDEDVLPGEEDYPGMGPREERVKRIVEPLGVTTSFEYSLRPETRSLFGKRVRVYMTRVNGPRLEVPSATYWMNAYGAVVEVERSAPQGVVAHTYTEWDATHLQPVHVVDDHNQRTQRKLNAAGEVVELRIYTSALPASDQGEPTEVEAIERWGYDMRHSLPTCHIDTEGRITLVKRDTETGLPLEIRTLAAQLQPELLASSASCEELASRLPQDPNDQVEGKAWCGIQDAPCPPGAQRGDWVHTTHANGATIQAAEYDPYGTLLRVEQR